MLPKKPVYIKFSAQITQEEKQIKTLWRETEKSNTNHGYKF